MTERRISRRDFLRTGGLTLAGVAAVGGYAGFIEPNRVTTKAVEIRLPRLPEAFDGIRIAQISDIHYGEFLGAAHLRDVVRTANTLQPDLIAITGDFATVAWHGNQSPKEQALNAAPCAPILQELHARLGRYAVLGNHDAGTDPETVTEYLSSHDIKLLRNEADPLERDGQRLWIAGIDDVLGGLARIPTTFAGIPKGEATIAMLHEPDPADEVSRYPADLQLSGHSHGGQVRIPGIGALVLPTLGRKYPMGLYKIRGMYLYTNPGVGVVNLPVRFDCPPEVTLFTLRRGS